MLDSFVTDICVEEFYRYLDDIEWELLKCAWVEDSYSSRLMQEDTNKQ